MGEVTGEMSGRPAGGGVSVIPGESPGGGAGEVANERAAKAVNERVGEAASQNPDDVANKTEDHHGHPVRQ